MDTNSYSNETPYGVYFILEEILGMLSITALGDRVNFTPVLFTCFIHMGNSNTDQVFTVVGHISILCILCSLLFICENLAA